MTPHDNPDSDASFWRLAMVLCALVGLLCSGLFVGEWIERAVQ